ncbi:MAG: hypothetical protein ACFUZC_07215 [Chthoniobacteraceae bacterium]
MISITGKPSGGKTICAVAELLKLCETDKRFIVTNIELVYKECQAYFLSQGKQIDFYRRVRKLGYDETAQFWRYRGGWNAIDLGPAKTVEKAQEWAEKLKALPEIEKSEGVILPEPPSPEEKGPNRYSAEWLNTVLQEASQLGGVIYFIDELHEHLNSRNWQKHGLVASDYAAIHAHCGDDVYWITQAPKLVDSAFRVRTQEYWFCENTAKHLLLGTFNGGGQKQFRIKVYLEPPTGAPGQVAQTKRNVSLNPRIARCYKRSRFGAQSDVGQKRRGIHLYWIYVFAAVLALGLAFVGIYLPQKLTLWGMNKGAAMTQDKLAKTGVKPGATSLEPVVSSPRQDATSSGASRLTGGGSGRRGDPDKEKTGAYDIKTETFRGYIGDGGLRTAESGNYYIHRVCPWGLVTGISDNVVLIRQPDGRLLTVVAVERSEGSLATPSPTPAPSLASGESGNVAAAKRVSALPVGGATPSKF